MIEHNLSAVNNRAGHFNDTLLSLETRETTLVEHYLQGNLCVHIHFTIIEWRGGFKPIQYCAFIKSATKGRPRYADETRHVFDESELRMLKHLPTKKQFLVFVPDVHFVENADNGRCIGNRCVVRLQGLDSGFVICYT